MQHVQPTTIASLLQAGLADGHTPWLEIISNSMLPLLRKGDSIQLVNCAVSDLAVGDIITFLGDGALVTHRFCGWAAHEGVMFLITRGDRPLALDKPFTEPDFVGKVVARRRGRRMVSLLSGIGGRVNRGLGRVTRLEERLFSGTYSITQKAQLTPPTSVLLGIAWRQNPAKRFTLRLIRRLLRAVTAMIALPTTLFSQPAGGEA